MVNIKSITPITIKIPLTQPITMGGILYKDSENLLTRVELHDGTLGWGEAPSAPTMTGETADSMKAAINYLIPHLLDRDPSLFVENMSLMDKLLYGNSSAKAAVEMALFDATGKLTKKSMSELIGGTRRDKTPVLWMLAVGKLEEDSDEAKQKLDEGFAAFKIKVGGKSVASDIDRSQAIRNIAGGHIQISADANQAWSLSEAKQFVEAAGEFLDFVEQPVMGNNLKGMAEISKSSDALIGADEGLHCLDDITRHKEMGSAAGGSLKMIKLGGVLKALEAAELCNSLGMKVNLAGKICETSIGSAAISHLASSVPQIDWALSITNQYAGTDIVKNPVRVLNGEIYAPDGYGLGVEVDEEKLLSIAQS
ncbi:MAG: enolase C-terminal domain-like protein [Pseudomonadota bacterium]|nr:enolase C-terminal domain-like protein [Pseudomonadota bacterium]